MKKSVLLTSLAALGILAACENTIRYEYDRNDAQITLHSQMSTAESDHSIFLSMSYPDRTESLTGASVVCYINDVRHDAVEQPVGTEEYYEYDPVNDDYVIKERVRNQRFTEYVFSAEIKPGDEVRVEASKGAQKAWAEVSVPQPARFVRVDTATVVRTLRYMDIDGGESWEDEFVDVTATIRDASETDSYFTLTASRLMEGEFRYYFPDGTLEKTEPYHSEEKSIWYETFHDRILEDGYSAGEVNDLLSELLVTNETHCFSDKEFRGGEATVRPSFESDRFYYSVRSRFGWIVPSGSVGELHSVFRLHLQTISRDFYNYLRAINNMKAYGYDVSPIIEPTMLPNNVVGGFGMVSVAAEDTYVFDFGWSVVDRSDGDDFYY